MTGILKTQELANSILQNNVLNDTLVGNTVNTLALQNENTLADMSVVGERELGVIGTV